MGISGCDPIRFRLLFERFITRNRIGGGGDADFAIMSAGRHKVIGSTSMAARLWMWSRRAFLKDVVAAGTSDVSGKGVAAQATKIEKQTRAVTSCGYTDWLRVCRARDSVIKPWALTTQVTSAFREFVAPRYRPELYYMRGPGPASAHRVNTR